MMIRIASSQEVGPWATRQSGGTRLSSARSAATNGNMDWQNQLKIPSYTPRGPEAMHACMMTWYDGMRLRLLSSDQPFALQHGCASAQCSAVERQAYLLAPPRSQFQTRNP